MVKLKQQTLRFPDFKSLTLSSVSPLMQLNTRELCWESCLENVVICRFFFVLLQVLPVIKNGNLWNLADAFFFFACNEIDNINLFIIMVRNNASSVSQQ